MTYGTNNNRFTFLENHYIEPVGEDCKTRVFYSKEVKISLLDAVKGKAADEVQALYNYDDDLLNGYSLQTVATILGVPTTANAVLRAAAELANDIVLVSENYFSTNPNNEPNSLDCFGDCFIGLQNSCRFGNPTSGLFVNQLEGVSLAMFSAVANEETIRGEQLFADIHTPALERVINDFEVGLSDDYTFNHTIEHRRVGQIGRNFSGSTTLKGFRLERHDFDIFQTGMIETISFKSDTTTNAVLYINGATGTRQMNIAVKKGRNDITVNFKTKEDQLDCWIDGCFNIADQLSQCGNCNELDCLTCVNTCGCYHVRFFEITGTNQMNFIGQNGIMVTGSCNYDIAPLICRFANDLKFAHQIAIGIRLMKEVEVTGSTHPLARNSKDDAKMLLKRWEGVNNEFTGEKIKSEYWRILSPVIKKAKNYLKSIGHTNWKECVSSYKYVETIP